MKLKDAKIKQPISSINRPVTMNRTSIYTEDVTGEYYLIRVDDLRPYSKQARLHFNHDRLNELAQTIKEHGIRQPLTVLPITDNPGKYEIVSGERRWRAAKLAGLDKVPCLILKRDQKADEIAIIENIQREDLHPIELGNAYKQLLESGICSSQEHLSDRLSVSRTKVTECISYTHLPREIQYILLEREISDRSILRKLKGMESTDDMRSYITATTHAKDNSHTPRLFMTSEPRVKSVMRIYVSDDHLRVNKRGLSKLTNGDKQILHDELKIILEELERELIT